jgi:probable rRNA maturation factor
MSQRKSAKRAKIDVDLVEDAGDWAFLENAQGLVEAAAAEVATDPILKISSAAVSVALSDDKSVAKLNGQYRGKPKATNVLSFPTGAVSREGFIGDIIVAAETLQREAADEDICVEHHFQHLIVHGLLHLLGFDHETEDEAERMEALEIKILARLGIANPYTGALNAAKT